MNVYVGSLDNYDKSNPWLSVAVHNGDVVAAVPETATYLLLLAGLLIIGAAAHQRRLRV